MGYIAPTWQNGGPPALNAKNMQDISDNLEYVSNNMVNPNLLDNWYFGNPVNQGGQTSWSGLSDYGMTIDRWVHSPSTVASLTSNGVTITADWQQYVENTRLLVGQQFTMSVLTSDGRLGQTTFTFVESIDVNVGVGVGYLVIYNGQGDPRTICRIYGDGSTYLAAKLELGSQQTLAHQENGKWVLNEIPKFGDQLAECQRYFRRLKFGPGGDDIIGAGYVYTDNFGRAMLALGAAMRTTPAMTHAPSARIIYDGTAYQATINSVRTATSPSLVSLELSVPAIPNQSIFMLVTGEPNAYIDLSAEL